MSKQPKSKLDKQTLKRVFTYLAPFKKRLGIIVFCFIIVTLTGFLQPLIIRRITDDGMTQKNLSIIIWSVIALLVLIAIEQGLEIFQTKLFAEIHNESQFNLFNQSFNKLLHIKSKYFDEKNNSEILNSMQMDVGNVSSITDRSTVMMVSYIFKVVSGLAGLFIISWKLTLVVLAMVPVKYIIVQKLARKKEKKMEEMIENSRDFSFWFGDNIEGIKKIRLWNLYGKRHKIFKEKQNRILENDKQNSLLDAWNMFCEILLEWSVIGALYILGGILIVNGTLTIGGLFAFLSYSSYVTGPISMIMNLRYLLSRILPSAKRLFSFLDLSEEENLGNKISRGAQEINLQQVSFSYNEGTEILKNLNLTISQGEKVAIIGANGSGKSTIINLLLRFNEPQSGQIIINGIDAQQLDINAYRSLFSVVSQNPYLFNDTINNNIDLRGEKSQADIEIACKQSNADGFIDRLPERGNTMTGRNAARLSGGEKQKVAVARAILKDTPIVLLDEATSGYDVESDRYLHDVIMNELENKTVLMITHRYDNLEGMDRVYRLENGELTQV